MAALRPDVVRAASINAIPPAARRGLRPVRCPIRHALILPRAGRTEKDVQRSDEQGVTVEDAMSMVHLSFGMKKKPRTLRHPVRERIRSPA
jgi:hypothetical protein